jgi:hypothetical protein
LWKLASSCLSSIHRSICMEQLCFPHGFSWSFIFEYLLKICQANSGFNNLTKRTGAAHEDLCTFVAHFFIEWDVSDKL